ncbi:MAG: response regulator [Planctomycetota bacterium]
MCRIQIIDDDYWCGEAIVARLMNVASKAKYDIKSIPTPDDGFDIYIVDNEFEDGDHGVRLVRRIRDRNPDATIVMCTATKERVDPETAMNAGCNAMIAKASTQGREELVRIVERHIRARARASDGRSFLAALNDIKIILAAWNTRMHQERLQIQ